MVKLNEELLRQEYIDNNMSETKIAEKYDMTRYEVSKLLNEYKIEKHKSDKELHDNIKNITQEEFYDMYVTKNMSYEEIGKLYNATARQIKRLNTNNFHCKKTKESKSINQRNGMRNYIDNNGDEWFESMLSRKKAVFDKYGVNNVFQLESVKEKIKQTNRAKYGVDNPMNNIDIRQKVSDSLRSKSMIKFNRLESEVEAVKNKENLKNYILSLSEEKRTFYGIAKSLNYSQSYITNKVYEYGLNDLVKYQTNTSHYEDELYEYLLSLGIDRNDIARNYRELGIELDLFVISKNVAIEFNGDYWHTVDKVGKDYHFNKSKTCEDNGIRLIHVYEYQWIDPIKQLILKSIIKNALGLNDNKIYARKCEIRELTVNDVIDFSNTNSLHQHRNASFYIGLFYNNELVELMSFGHAYFANDPSIDSEVIRSITKIGYTVVGGMNKLMQYFIKTYNPNKILYYVDYNTHNGNSMSKMGFEFKSYSQHGMINISRDSEVTKEFGYAFNRNPARHKEIKQLISEGKVSTIYDAGVKKYIWTKENK